MRHNSNRPSKMRWQKFYCRSAKRRAGDTKKILVKWKGFWLLNDLNKFPLNITYTYMTLIVVFWQIPLRFIYPNTYRMNQKHASLCRYPFRFEMVNVYANANTFIYLGNKLCTYMLGLVAFSAIFSTTFPH